MTYNHLDKGLDVLSLFAPFLLIASFIFMSLYNQDLKGVVMVFGIFISLKILQTLQGNFKIDDSDVPQYKEICTLFNTIPTPGSSSLIISFVFTYLLLPMMHNNHYNPMVLISLIVLFFLDIYYKAFRFKCFKHPGVFAVATAIGTSVAISFFYAFFIQGEIAYNLLYFDVSKQNRVQCDRLNTELYECSDAPEEEPELPVNDSCECSDAPEQEPELPVNDSS